VLSADRLHRVEEPSLPGPRAVQADQAPILEAGQEPGLVVEFLGESGIHPGVPDHAADHVTVARALGAAVDGGLLPSGDGRGLENAAGETLGQIEDLLLDPLRGTVAYAILSLEGFLGTAAKLFAVPLPALYYRGEDAKFVLYADKDTLKRAPGFERDRWPNLN